LLLDIQFAVLAHFCNAAGAGGRDMVLEEPYEDFFNLRTDWDTAIA
jgi:hypothetical protein